MFKVIDVNKRKEWNAIIKEFKDWDIYYLYEYAHSLMLHGEGIPKLIYYKNGAIKIAYVMMENDIAEFAPFSGVIQKRKLFDWTTPYGYGGPLYEGEIDKEELDLFCKELFAYCTNFNIVSQFFRYNPLSQNQFVLGDLSENVLIKRTVYMEAGTHEYIMKGMTSECRNRVRKAQKSGIEITYDYGENINEFMDIYKATMDFHNAEKYYYFGIEYFKYLINELKENIVIFYAKHNGKTVSAALFFFNEKNMHYHLGGTYIEYRKYAPFNLLLVKAAEWAFSNGKEILHLGGGTEADDDLFRFKKKFNLDGIMDFYIGRTIFLHDKFDELIKIRKDNEELFNENVKYMIVYRA